MYWDYEFQNMLTKFIIQCIQQIINKLILKQILC